MAAEASGNLRHFPAHDNKSAIMQVGNRALQFAFPRWISTLNSMRREGTPESRKLAGSSARRPHRLQPAGQRWRRSYSDFGLTIWDQPLFADGTSPRPIWRCSPIAASTISSPMPEPISRRSSRRWRQRGARPSGSRSRSSPCTSSWRCRWPTATPWCRGASQRSWSMSASAPPTRCAARSMRRARTCRSCSPPAARR